jgi:hypothetical protein
MSETAENKLFSVTCLLPLKIKTNFGYFWLFFWRTEAAKIGHIPQKISYFRRYMSYFLRLLATENDCIL